MEMEGKKRKDRREGKKIRKGRYSQDAFEIFKVFYEISTRQLVMLLKCLMGYNEGIAYILKNRKNNEEKTYFTTSVKDITFNEKLSFSSSILG